MRSQLSVLAAALVLAACGPQGPENDAGAPAAQAPAPEPAAVSAPITMAAADYVSRAAVLDSYEIAAAQVALQSSQNADVKAFAEMIVQDHGKATADMKIAIAQSGQSLPVPSATPADRQALLDLLNAATAADFDGLYLAQQVQAHEESLKLHQAYAQSGDVASLKAFASAIVPVIQRHLDQVRQLRDRTVTPSAAARVPAAPTEAAKAAPAPAPAPKP